MIGSRWVRDVRSRLLLIVVAALAVAFTLAVVAFVLLLGRATTRDANAFLRARAATGLELVRVDGRRVRLASSGADSAPAGGLWVYQGAAPVRLAGGDAATLAAVRSLVGGPPRFLNVHGSDLRLYASPIEDRGRRVGTLVTGVSLDPYEHTRNEAVTSALVLFALILALVGIAVWWLLRSALRPVAQMTEQAAAWSENDLDRRFALGAPHDELTRLAGTLDSLLDRLAASLRHERRFSAEMSHELRTPLAKLMAEAELALRRERTAGDYRGSLGIVLRNAQQIERIVESLVAAARQTSRPQGVASAREVAVAAVAACGLDADVLAHGPDARVGVDRDLAERILHPVVENACRYGRSAVSVKVAREGSAVLFAIEDDGPGVREHEEHSIFEPAVRGSAGRTTAGGAGLGLSLARRLARAASGDVLAEPGSHGRFVVRLPAV